MNTFKFRTTDTTVNPADLVMSFIRKTWQIGVPYPEMRGSYGMSGGFSLCGVDVPRSVTFEVTFSERKASGRIPGDARLQAEEFAKISGCKLLN